MQLVEEPAEALDSRLLFIRLRARLGCIDAGTHNFYLRAIPANSKPPTDLG